MTPGTHPGTEVRVTLAATRSSADDGTESRPREATSRSRVSAPGGPDTRLILGANGGVNA
jgi:hypothetical protein